MSALSVIIIIAISYLIICLAGGCVLGEYLTHPRTNNFEEEKLELLALGFDAETLYKTTPHSDYVCESYGDYEIHYSIFEKQGSKKTVLISHGYVGNRYSSLVYVNMFLKMGYNCIIFDQRNHGENVKSFTSLGFYEEKDLRFVLKSALEELGCQEKTGLLGVSMGAATCLMASNHINKLDFVIEDSGYSSLMDLVRSLLNPALVYLIMPAMLACSLYLKVKYGFFMKEVSPKECVQKFPEDLPVLFIHSKIDKKVPYSMFDKLYKAKSGAKYSYVADDADHAKLIFTYPEEYGNVIAEFLNESV